MSADKSGSPQCGIYVQINDFSNMLDNIGYVRQMALVVNRASGYEKNMVVIELAYSKEYEERLIDFIPIVRDQGFVVVISGNVEIAAKADGILIDNLNNLNAMREALGDDAIIGINCKSKKAAEECLSATPDYVVLNADPSLISWWSASTEILSCARSKKGLTASNCGALAAAGASFVDVSDYILKHKKGIMQGTVNVQHEIEQGLAMPKALN